MTSLVVDTSVVAKWFLDEEHANLALELLDARIDLHAPDFLELELAHVLGKKVRRGELRADEARSIHRCFEDFPVRRHDFTFIQDAALELTLAYGRGIYDCLFVALAEVLDLRLVTADRRLVEGLGSTPMESRLLWIEDASI